MKTFAKGAPGRPLLSLLAVAAFAFLSTWPGLAESAGTRQISYPQLVNTGVGGQGYAKNGWTRNSVNPSISADGKWVVFRSQSSNLDELEKEETKPFSAPELYEYDIFLHSVDTGKTVRVSEAWDGGKADGKSINPSISPNGEWVVFESDASNLVSGDTNGVRDIFRYHRVTGYMNRASVRNSGTQTDKPSYKATVDNSGAAVFHTKDASMTSTQDLNDNHDIFLRKIFSTKLVSKKSDGSSAANQASTDGVISGDGSAVAFQSFADDLLPQPKGGAAGFDVYLHSVAGSSNELVSVTPAGESGGSSSLMPSISEDGDKIAFTSYAKDLVSPELSTSQWRTFIRDVGGATSSTKKITDSTAGEAHPSISPDGTHVAVERQSTTPIPIVVYDLQAGTSEVASRAANGDIADGDSKSPSIANSQAGEHRVVFESNSNRLFHNYLGVGLLNWDELTAYKVGDNNVGFCGDGSFCNQVYVREMAPSAPEPGLHDPNDSAEPEPLVSVGHDPEGAGKPTDVTVTLRRPQDYHEFKDVEFKMPVGIGASLDIPTCDKNEAETASCPEDSKVGDVRADVAMLNSIQDIPAFLNVPKHGIDSRVSNCNKNWEGFIPDMDADFDGIGEPCTGSGVFFGTPEGDEAARLYAVIQDTDLLTEPVVVDLVVYLVEDEHYRVKVVSEIPNTTENVHVQQYKPMSEGGTKSTDLKFQSNKVDGKAILNLNINRVEIVINGETSDGKTFLTNPTFDSGAGSTDPDIDQGQKKVQAKIETYGGTHMERNDLEFPVSGASNLPFNPTLDVDVFKANTAQVAKPKEVVDVVAKVEKATGQSDIRETKVTFPAGIQVNSLAEIKFCWWGNADFSNCGPAGATDVGDVTVKTSALPEDLRGDVYLIDGLAPGDPLTMAVFLDEYTNGVASPVKLKLFGEVKLNQDKRIVAEFKDLPPYPLSEFEMKVNGLLTTGGVPCGQGTTELPADATITPWTKEIAPVSLEPKVTVNSDCTGAASSGFDPKLSVTSDNYAVGQSPGKLELSVTRKASDDPMTDFDLTLPQGLVGDLDATASRCTLSQAEGGGCPASSKIGHVTATAQIFKGKTITVEGGLYNALPGSGEFGRFIASFDLPEIAGGGKLVLKSAVDPIDNAQAIVTKVAGAPPEFNITDIKMKLLGKTANGTEGPLLINPTFASNGSFTLDATSAHSSKASSSAPYPVTGSLGFTPHLNASLSTTKLGAKPTISTEIGQQVQETAIQSMRLSFKGFGLDITKGLSGCSALDRGLGTCPPASKVADITAHSWLIPTPLQGSLYLGEGAKTAFMSLNGPITLNVEGDVAIDAAKGAVSVDINKGLPPISGSRIQATVNSGLFKNPDKCGHSAEIALDSTSYAGQSHSESKKIDYCKGASSTASLKVKLRPRKTNSYTKASFTLTQSEKKGAKKLKSLEIKLGKGRKALRASTKALKRKTRRSRRAKTVGTLSLTSAKKGRSVKAKVLAKRGRIYISPSTKQLKRYRRTLKRLSRKGKRSSKAYRRAKSQIKSLKKIHRYLKKKTRARILKSKLRLTGLPTKDAYWRISLTLNGKRFHTLRNPKRPGKVTFNAKAKTSTGSSIKASYTVKVKKEKKGKRPHR